MNPHEIRIAEVDGRRFAYRARQVLALTDDAVTAATNEANERSIAAERVQFLDGGVTQIRFYGPEPDEAVDDLVLHLVRNVERFGVQPNHVFFAHMLPSELLAAQNTQLPPLLPPHVEDPTCCSDGADAPQLPGSSENGLVANPFWANPFWANPFWANPFWANPFWANPFWANPFWANPFWANPSISSAIPTDPPSPLPEQQSRPADPYKVFVLDSGLGDYKDVVNRPPVSYAEANERPPHEPGRSPAPMKRDDYRNDWIKQRDYITGDHWDRADLAPLPWGDGYIDGVAGHGTFIAGVYEQLVPGQDISVRGIIGRDGAIDELTIALRIAEILKGAEADGSGAQTIINMSFGGPLFHTPDVVDLVKGMLLHQQIKLAHKAKMVLIGSAGNEGICERTYPAAFSEVVGVGALAKDGPAEFSNRGDWVNASTIGVNIRSTFLPFNGAGRPVFEFADSELPDVLERVVGPRTDWADWVDPQDPDDFDSGWAIWSGTSFAAPIVGAAIIACAAYSGISLADAKDKLLKECPQSDCFGALIGPEPFFPDNES